MEFLKIVLFAVIAAILYGIVHDQITAHICVEYFSIFHPPLINSRSPILLAFAWGAVATWWAGLAIGLVVAVSARAGRKPRIAASALVKPIVKLLLFMAACALAFGCIGFSLSTWGHLMPPLGVRAALPTERHARFMADWWAHNASYASGFVGGIFLACVTFRKRTLLAGDRI